MLMEQQPSLAISVVLLALAEGGGANVDIVLGITWGGGGGTL